MDTVAKQADDEEIYEGGARVSVINKAYSTKKDEDNDESSEIEAEQSQRSLFARIQAYYRRHREWQELKVSRENMKRRMHREARRRLKVEDTVKPAQNYKTLYYGLKKNHERNVAVVHPLMFMLRRIIFALVIVFMDEIMFWGVLVVMFSCLIMLAYVLHEQQWQDRIINRQHTFNEIITYFLCVILLFYSSYVEAKTRDMLGFVLIGICFVFVIVNTIVIIIYSLGIIWTYIKRIFVQCRVKRVRSEVIQVVKKLNDGPMPVAPSALKNDDEDKHDDKSWFEPSK